MIFYIVAAYMIICSTEPPVNEVYQVNSYFWEISVTIGF